MYYLFFFFSSRRRHTRSLRDWSSDVCSSDLYFAALDEATSAKYWPARQYPASIKEEYLSPSILPQVSEQLRSLGYNESSIRAIMSGNFMRVASQVWAR